VSVGQGNPQMVLIWVQLLGDLSFFPALIQPAERFEEPPEVLVGVAVVGIQRQGPSVGFLCSRPFPRSRRG
jgi:hypothetical protein